jgi:signal transduction histidine kinase
MSKTLEQKNTRYLLTWLPFVLLLGSVLFYIILTGHASHMQEKQLELKQQNIWKAFVTGPLPMEIPGEYTISKNITDVQVNKILDADSGYTVLTKEYKLNGIPYLLTTYVTSKEYTHLLIKVFATEVFIFILLLASIVFINRRNSRRLWQPFYKTLQTTSAYDVANNTSIILLSYTGITEFDQLNKELSDLIQKTNKAYSSQKQFVENASHEIQTPLAIIRSKLELLINEQGLTEQTALLLADITQANDRLSQLNKSLLLLAKIDNNQFPELEPVNISKLLIDLISNYELHYDNFPVSELTIHEDVYIHANAALTEVLFSNLIKNAVVHNYAGGYIKVILNNKGCSIINTGSKLTSDPATLFERFHKGNAASRTTGLGLALVKQIAKLYRIEINYQHENGIHTIQLCFAR